MTSKKWRKNIKYDKGETNREEERKNLEKRTKFKN